MTISPESESASPQPRVVPDWRFVWSHPAHVLSFAGGAGLSPKAPGTMGSLVALPLYWAAAQVMSWPWLLGLAVLGLLIGIWACDVTGKALGISDYGGIVWDEVVGQWLVLMAGSLHPLSLLLGFGLFRLFDIWKPWPISWADRTLPGGLGVMVDDVLAAGYAAALLWWLHPWLGL